MCSQECGFAGSPHPIVPMWFGVDASLITDWRLVKLLGELRFAQHDKMLLSMLLAMSLTLSLIILVPNEVRNSMAGRLPRASAEVSDSDRDVSLSMTMPYRCSFERRFGLTSKRFRNASRLRLMS